MECYKDRMVESVSPRATNHTLKRINQQVVKMLQVITNIGNGEKKSFPCLINSAEKWISCHLNVLDGHILSATRWVTKMWFLEGKIQQVAIKAENAQQ